MGWVRLIRGEQKLTQYFLITDSHQTVMASPRNIFDSILESMDSSRGDNNHSHNSTPRGVDAVFLPNDT